MLLCGADKLFEILNGSEFNLIFRVYTRSRVTGVYYNIIYRDSGGFIFIPLRWRRRVIAKKKNRKNKINKKKNTLGLRAKTSTTTNL